MSKKKILKISFYRNHGIQMVLKMWEQESKVTPLNSCISGTGSRRYRFPGLRFLSKALNLKHIKT